MRTPARVVHFNDHLFHKAPLGLGRYGRELFAALGGFSNLSVRAVGTWSNLSPGELQDLCRRTHSALISGGRRRWILQWHFTRYPLLENLAGEFDLLHFTAPGYVVPTRRPTVATIHDVGLLSHPWFFSKSYPFLFRAHLKDLVRRRASLICVSSFTADQLRRTLASPRLDVDVIHEGVGEAFLSEPDEAQLKHVRAKYRLNKPYILSVGSLNPRKNIPRVLQAFEAASGEIPHELLLVGARGWDDEALHADLRDGTLGDRIRFLGFVTDAELNSLYRYSGGLLFGSLFEGFGLPVLEAMACGCPVIAARASSLPELTGEAAILVDPLDVEAMAGAILRLCREPSLREELRERGYDRSRRFRWSETARQTAEVYRRALDGGN